MGVQLLIWEREFARAIVTAGPPTDHILQGRAVKPDESAVSVS